MDYLLLEIKDIKGESKLAGFADMIEVLSFSHGLAQYMLESTSNNGRTSGRPNIQDLTLSKSMDVTSPVLLQKCLTAADVGTVKLHLVRQDGAAGGDAKNAFAYMVYELGHTLISSVSVGGGGGGMPVETVSLNFDTIKWTYKKQKAEVGSDGNIVGSWDQSKNTTGS